MEIAPTISASIGQTVTEPLPRRRGKPLEEEASASLQQAGLHTLRFDALPPATVAYRMGERYPFIDKLRLPGIDNVADKAHYVQRRLEGFRYEIHENHIEAEFYHPLPYQLYAAYLPYSQIKEMYPETCQLLVTFLKLGTKLGLTFWSETYYADFVMYEIKEDVECYFAESGMGDESRDRVVKEAEAITKAVECVRIKKPSTLRRRLLAVTPKNKREATLVNTMLRWVNFLERDDHIDRYVIDDTDGDDDEGYDKMQPSERFIILPVWGDAAEECWQEGLHHCHWLDLGNRFTIDKSLDIPAIPTFPMQFSCMAEEIITAIDQLT